MSLTHIINAIILKVRLKIWPVIFVLLLCQCQKKEAGPDRMQQIMALQNMSHLATAEYVVTKVVKANDNKTWYKIGDRKILMTAKASVVAGVDLSKLDSTAVRIDGDAIDIVLPHAKLLYVSMKPEDLKTAYQDVSLFRDKFSEQEKNQLAKQAEIQIRESIPDLGVLVTAETNAQVFLDQFLKNLGYKTIRIRFENPKQRLQ